MAERNITKTDITGSKELGGAKLVVKDKNGNVVDSWTSAEGETHIIEGKLIAGETYILHEEQSPDGYAIASDVIFEVGEDGKVQTVVMKDETTKIHVSKTDITGDKELGGAKLVVKDVVRQIKRCSERHIKYCCLRSIAGESGRLFLVDSARFLLPKHHHAKYMVVQS